MVTDLLITHANDAIVEAALYIEGIGLTRLHVKESVDIYNIYHTYLWQVGVMR